MTKPHTPSEDETARRALTQYLQDAGIKNTSQRRKVLDAVLSLPDHFEPEQVIFALRESGSRVAKATVYRTLPLLVDCGILKKVRFDDNQNYYERALGEEPHDHMVCRRCGKIIEFSTEDIPKLRDRIAAKHYFHPTGHRFQISGLCWECSVTCPITTAKMNS